MNGEKVEITPVPVMSESSFELFLSENGYVHRVKGTYYSEATQTFLYRKPKALFNSRDVAAKAKKTYEELTRCGILHPDTAWHMYQKDNGLFQVFAVSPKLSQAKDDMTSPRLPSGPVEKYELLVGRLPADAEETGLQWFVDPMEIQCRTNWGYDPDADEYYVVDVEAVMFDGEDMFKDSNQAAMEAETQETSIKKL